MILYYIKREINMLCVGCCTLSVRPLFPVMVHPTACVKVPYGCLGLLSLNS